MRGTSSECPCRHCKPENGRSGECHAHCERYDEWVYAKDKMLREIRQERDKQLGVFKHYITSVQFNELSNTFNSKYKQV